MNHSNENERRRDIIAVPSRYPWPVVLASLGALVSTFVLADSSALLQVKSIGFAGIVGLFLVFVYAVQPKLGRWDREARNISDLSAANADNCLNALEEANDYIAGSLKTADVFRLIISRIGDVIPLAGAQLFLLDETRTSLRLAASDVSATETGPEKVVEFDDSTAHRCFSSGSVVFGPSRPGSNAEDCNAASIAIPLRRDADAFGVLHLYARGGCEAPGGDGTFFDAVAKRAAPLVISSIAYEKTEANALTDAITDLPNERAFHLILENQIAEAHRNRGDRPLTILTMDIKNFGEINQKYGHAAGDRVLNFAATTIRDSLRQMDFFARASNDEFLAILPTATKEISHDVIARVSTSFLGRKLKITDADVIEVILNFGWAAFGEDGETADHLLAAARIRKGQSKSVDPSNVLWFAREMAH